MVTYNVLVGGKNTALKKHVVRSQISQCIESGPKTLGRRRGIVTSSSGRHARMKWRQLGCPEAASCKRTCKASWNRAWRQDEKKSLC